MSEPIDYTTMEPAAMIGELGDNAAKWAAAFCQHAKKLDGYAPDEGWMIGWFANAIEHSHSIRTRAALSPAPTVPPGFKLVPVEPTQAMLGPLTMTHDTARKLWAVMLAASPQPPVVEGWRDIASAPKDGTFVLIRDSEVRALASWQRDRWFGIDELGLAYDSRQYHQPGPQPSHWQPLPAPPAAPEATHGNP